MRPVCVKCQCEMKCAKNSRAVLAHGSLWHGDSYTCEGCGATVVCGFGSVPVARPRDPNWESWLQLAKAEDQLVEVIEP